MNSILNPKFSSLSSNFPKLSSFSLFSCPFSNNRSRFSNPLRLNPTTITTTPFIVSSTNSISQSQNRTHHNPLHLLHNLHTPHNQITLIPFHKHKNEALKSNVHNSFNLITVHIKHRRTLTQQVPPEKLRIQVPNLANHVPHDRLFVVQLRCDCAAQNCSNANDSVSASVFQDRYSQFGFLCFGCVWEGVVEVLGNAKGAVAVVVSILIFRNPVSVTGIMGYSLIVLGVVLYSEAKKRSK